MPSCIISAYVSYTIKKLLACLLGKVTLFSLPEVDSGARGAPVLWAMTKNGT